MNNALNADEQSETDRAYYRRIASEYFQRYEQPIQKYSTRIEERWLRELVNPGSRILLVGVGGGRELTALLEHDCRITALDYSEEMLEAGRHHWASDRINWVLGDAHDLHEHREQYDAVISLAAINYFIDARRAIAEMCGSLVSGGRFIVSSINSLHRSEQPGRKSAALRKVTRILYAPDELRRLAEDASMTVEEVRGIRYCCDLLPPLWNTPKALFLQRTIISATLAVEPIMQRLFRADRAKFFWLVARR